MDENWESMEIFESFEDSFVSWGQQQTTTATKDSSAQIDCGNSTSIHSGE